MSTITTQDIVRQQAPQFTTWLHAFMECSQGVQKLILEMSEIISDRESTYDERDHATDVIIEALFPGVAFDARCAYRDIRKAEEYRHAHEELVSQEKIFASQLRQLMEERGLTQEKLADMTGVSQPAISNILNRNCRPQQKTIQRFAEAFDVDPAILWPTDAE